MQRETRRDFAGGMISVTFVNRLNLILATLISVSFFPNALSSQEDRDILLKNFDLFLDAAHSRDACGLTILNCQVSLQKRIEPYHFQASGANSFQSHEVGAAASRALARASLEVTRATGIRLRTDRPDAVDKFIHMVFVNKDQFLSYPEEFIRAWIAPPTLSRPAEREAIFQHFLSSGLPCLTISDPYPNGEIRTVYIWIRVDLSEEKMSRCVAEEYFNSFGFGDGVSFGYSSIFDWPSGNDTGVDDGSIFYPTHLAFLRALYDPRMVGGQSRQETENVLRQIIRDLTED